ncbi:MAG: 16S rRNA (adenine(1518)-N(6)/adenine(1519)-N(6)) -dimethyltransferase RsmA [Candidatus Rifleibacteriota bacterium]
MKIDRKPTEKIPAKKSLGQNFCIDERIPQEILERLDATKDCCIWEIGPGKGALTQKIMQTGAEMVLFEIDRRMEPLLTENFPNAKIVWGDFLELPLKELPTVQKPLLVCGNLPYYCGTPIIRRFLENGPKAKRLVFLLQQEVALKAAARENTPDYGFLSVVIAFFAKASVGNTFPPESFSPPPKINSTILQIEPLDLTSEERTLRLNALKSISIIFAQRRKMALPLLKKRIPEFDWENRFKKLGIDFKARPENIPPEKLLKLFS